MSDGFPEGGFPESAMTDLERFHACMNYAPVDRTPFWAWGGWPETMERWEKEGFQPDRFDPESLADRRHWMGNWFFPHPPFERRVIAADDRHVTFVNEEGILMKERGMTEDESYVLIRKSSMNKRVSMKEIAEAIILSQEIRKW